MEIIIFIIGIVILINKMKNKTVAQTKETTPNQPRTNQPRTNQPRSDKTPTQLKEEIWSRLSDESKAKMLQRDSYQNHNTYHKDSEEEDISAAEQIRRRRMEERNTSILDRAKGNNAENAKDLTLDTMEAEHNHSERVAPAIHHHPEVDLSESMLGSVEDLMAKGYDGNLCFERDFLGEGLDMIGRFTAPCEIPDYGSNQ